VPYFILENEEPADLSFTCFQEEAWRVCQLISVGIAGVPVKVKSTIGLDSAVRCDPT
jgi:hypothetical protein